MKNIRAFEKFAKGKPAKTERNIELTQDYLIDLAMRIEKMCGMIFGLNPSSN